MDFMKNKPLIINIISMIFLILTWICDFFFLQGDKTFRIVLMAVTLWLVYFVYKKTFLRRSRVSFYLIYSFVFAAMYLGSILDFYTEFYYWDKILHLLSGAIIALIGYIIYLNLTRGSSGIKSYMPVFFSVIFAIAAAGAWEIWEFSTDQIFGFTSQNNSLHDTMWDIICGTITAILANIPIYLYTRGKRIKFIERIIKDME